jgi:hypothetical protein
MSSQVFRRIYYSFQIMGLCNNAGNGDDIEKNSNGITTLTRINLSNELCSCCKLCGELKWYLELSNTEMWQHIKC